MPTGIEIRGAMQKRGLVVLGKSTTVGAVNYLVDTIRQQRTKLSPQEYGNAEIRIIAGDSNNNGFVGEVERIDPATGRIYISPSVANAFASGASYEIWKYGISSDDADRARDGALTEKCSTWRPKVLSVLSDVAEWSVSAYSAGSGGETDAAGAVQTLAFPHEYAAQAMRITNSGANGILGSEAYDVQPDQRFVVWGLVSVRAQTASLRVRDLTNGADITLDRTAEFTLQGWQSFERRFTIPAGCSQIELWPGGASATCIADWAGIGLLSLDASEINLPSRVDAKTNVGRVFQYWRADNIYTASAGNQVEVPCWRDKAGALVRLRFEGKIAGPMYYEERHFYSALATDYLTVANRTAGDAATTDCPLRYVEAATVVELLQHAQDDAHLNKIYLNAVADVNHYERDLGPEPIIPGEPPRSRPYLMRL